MNILRRIFDILLGAMATLSIALATFALINQVTFATVTTSSMAPAIRAGDTVISKMINESEINEGDVLVLSHPDNPRERFAHRVVGIEKGQDDIRLITKGDANPSPDAWRISLDAGKVARVISVIPTSPLLDGPLTRQHLINILLSLGIFLGLLSAYQTLRIRRSRHEV